MNGWDSSRSLESNALTDEGRECTMLYCVQPAENGSDYCPQHRHGVYRDRDAVVEQGDECEHNRVLLPRTTTKPTET